MQTFITVLQEIQELFTECTVSGKNMAHWEREIARAWEGLVDKAQPSS